MSSAKLFQPIEFGDGLVLQHRIVFAPSTRYRADHKHVPLPHVAEYYAQRSSTPGSLLISEATFIAERAGGENNAPGIWSDAQIAAWKKITDGVHAKGAYIYSQLWALGRAAYPTQLALDDPSLPFVSASDVKLSEVQLGHKGADAINPRPLTKEEIKEYVQLYATAASNAVHKAGFDGVEIHGANGYLLDQFFHDSSNLRTDEYGGSIENRARFALEVVDAVVQAVGVRKTGFRISPWGTYLDMYMKDPKPVHAYLAEQLRSRYPNMSHLHVVEPRVDGSATLDVIPEGFSNDFLREIWRPQRFISAGGYTRQTAIETAEEKGDLIAFSRAYIANPDLPYRLLHDIPLTKGDRSKYYAWGSTNPAGYTDYPFADVVA